MSLLSWAERLYSLDTLDTRFTTSTKLPPSRPDPVTSSPEESREDRNGQKTLPQGAKPPKWRTPEFMIYGFVFLTVVPLMFWTVYDVSRREQPPLTFNVFFVFLLAEFESDESYSFSS